MWQLINNPSDHPLATLKSARKLLVNLPKDDTVIFLQEISHWVVAIHDQENEFKLNHQLELLRLLDETAHVHIVQTMSKYFSTQALSDFQSNRMWTTLKEYFTCTAEAYLSLVRSHHNGVKKSASLKQYMPLITARAMHALGGRLKLAAVRYEAVAPEVWLKLAELYAYAEAQEFLDEHFALYEGYGADTTVRNILAGMAMWQACGKGTLKPVQIHIAEHLVHHLDAHLTIDEHYVPGSLMTFDLRRGRAPMRMDSEATVHPGLRFIGVASAPQHLRNLISKLEKGSIPDELEIKADYSAAVILEVAQHLARGVSSAPPVRRDTRRRVSVNLCVASGLSRLDELASHRSRDCETGESWDTEDISSNGFLCVLPAGNSSNVKVGELIGLQPEKMLRWGAGIVKRLSHDSKNNLLIGVEMLSNQITGVTLHDDKSKSGISMGVQRALYLNKPEIKNEEAWLLMKPDGYSGAQTLAMTMEDRDYLLVPLELLKQGDDYVLARFRKLEHGLR